MTRRKRVYLAIPYYDSLAGGTLPTVLQAGVNFDFSLGQRGGSSLCKNFNALWCSALKLRKEFDNLHFVMLHADIRAESGWLDKLIRDYDQSGADVLSAVIAIKTEEGLTSTGIAVPGVSPVRRFTMREVSTFPPIFTAASAGFPGLTLALNTGLWIADMHRPWVTRHWPLEYQGDPCRVFPAFQTMDWIRQLPAGDYVEEFFPEDWLRSQWYHDNGVKVAATRNIRAWHKGAKEYESGGEPWGLWETDRAAQWNGICNKP